MHDFHSPLTPKHRFGFSGIRPLLALITCFLFSGSMARATNYIWTGATSSNWATASNWRPSGVPGAQDTVSVPSNLTVETASDVVVAGLTLAPKSTLQGAGKVTVSTSATITDALLRGTGALEIAPGATLNFNTIGTRNGLIMGLLGTLVNTVVNILIDKPIRNQGILNLNGGNLQFGAAFENLSSATFNLNCDSVLAGNSLLPPTCTNYGTVQKLAGAGASTIALPFINKGSLRAESGTVNFYKGFTQNTGSTLLKGGHIQSPQTLQFAGGRLGGIGIVQGSTVNSGATIAPGFSPGSIVINGNYAQSANGTLEMELGGTAPGKLYDQLLVTGSATLGGTLNIVQYNGFVPAAGSSFLLMEYLTVSGSFAKVNNLFPAVGRYFNTTAAPSELIAQTLADSTPPAVAIAAPLANKGYASLASMSGTASDGGSGVASVTIKLFRAANGALSAGYWNGTSWDAVYSAAKNELPANGTAAWNWAPPALAATKYSVAATVKDKAGNVKVSSEVPFWIDNAQPNIAIASPANGAVVSSLSAVSGTANDGSGSGIARVDLTIKRLSDNLFWNGTTWTAAAAKLTTSLANGAWSRSTAMPTGALLLNGQYQIGATAVDNANLQRVVVSNVTVNQPSQ